jgi:integrase
LREHCKDLKFIHGENFDTDIMHYKNNKIEVVSKKINVLGLYELIVKILWYFKSNNLLGLMIHNSGEKCFFSPLSIVIEELSKSYGSKLTMFQDIEEKHIKKVLITFINRKNKLSTIRQKIGILRLWLRHNEQLPTILKLHPRISHCLENDYIENFMREYKNLKGNESLESNINEDGTNTTRTNLIDEGFITNKEQVPLYEMQKLILKAFEYVKYSDEILNMAEVLRDSYKEKCSTKKDRILYEGFFKLINNIDSFKEPMLNKWRKKLSQCKSYYVYDKKGRNTAISIKGGMRSDFLKLLDLFEASCISIALLGSGMRISELTMLNRELEFEESEHYMLKRVISKTAIDETGEDLIRPIPIVLKKILECLVKIANIKDLSKGKYLLLGCMSYDTRASILKNQRLNTLLNLLAKEAGIKSKVTSHNFRHTIAYLVASSDDEEGLELASMLLGHKSTRMTLNYLSLINVDIANARLELDKSRTNKLINKIVDKVEKKEKIFGEKAKFLNPDASFVGKMADKFRLSLKKNLRELVAQEKILILQSTHCLCIHDLTQPESLKCQIGHDLESIAKGPYISRCEGSKCGNSIFFEEDVKKLKEIYGHIEDDEIRERLERNTAFMQVGGFDNVPYSKLIKEYDEYYENKKLSS